MKHTQGPWHIGREQDHSADRWKRNVEWSKIRGENNGLIATIESVNPKGKRQSIDFDIEAANAQLIAAAPDLLEIAQWISDRITEFGNLDHIRDEEIIETLDQAIAKATGGE